MKRLARYLFIGLLFIGNVTAQTWLDVQGELTLTESVPPFEYSGITVGSGMPYDYGNRLFIRNGGHVRCLGSMYANGTVSTGVDYGWLYSYASISGNESLLEIGGDLRLSSSDLPGRYPLDPDDPWKAWGVPCHLEISGGAEVSVGGDISIINRSTLRLNSGGKLTVGSDFDASMTGFNYGEGSTLSMKGQLSGLSTLTAGQRLETPDLLGDLTVHGTFAPGNSPADSIVDGGLTIAADGMLEMELGGYALGSGYDRLTVTGLSSLDGTLDIVLLDDFSLAYGDSFDLFNWDGGVPVGQFATITTNALSAGLYWETENLYTTGRLSVIPEPGVITLMVVFGSGFWFIRRYFPTA